MNTSDSPELFNTRILIIDDNPSIHDDFRKVLSSGGSAKIKDLEGDEAELFGTQKSEVNGVEFELTSAFQGQEALETVRAAAQAGRPFALAFVDVRMPPGWDGIETIRRIWSEFSDLQVVICTAYSDYSWNDITAALGPSDSVLILKKPFDSVEVLQLAHALTKKWNLGKMAQRQMEELDRAVNQRTTELRAANEQLKNEVLERSAAEAALRRSEERFSKAFQASPVPMAIEHLERSEFIDVNGSFEKMTGLSREALLGNAAAARDIWQDPATPGLVRELMNQDSPPRELPVSVRTKDGGRREALLFTEIVELGGEDHMLLIAQDITEHARLEGQLRQAQKMEAVGRLAAGIAHDFNNILTVIIGNTSLQLTNPDLNENLARSLTQVVKAADRATELTRQLLAYSRKQIIQRRAVDLNDQLEQTVAMVRRVIGEDIAIVTELAEGLPPIFADASNVDQVFMNLVLNARDAMPDGGRLVLSTSACSVGAAEVELRPEARAGDFVRVTVRDSGCGMDTPTLARIFEPFFTTKELGRGTGMGLATAYGIVKQHDGWIEVRSEPGKGTTFDIHFPVFTGTMPVIVAPVESGSVGEARPDGTILVVEDEEMLRVFVSEVLESFGYRVLSAANGAEALKIWAEEKDGIDLLLTDIVMPESISGRQLARQLVEEKRRLKVIYTSGYSPELIGTEFETEPEANFLAKPYQSDRLATLVSRCLATRAA
jgi:PAS domain S-box-containing protein